MPKLWSDTIKAHRREVRDAILDSVAALVAEHGLLSVTMSQIAQSTGIGRATLYKYFSDVEAIVVAWHERVVAGHLDILAEVRDRPGAPDNRLQAVLATYAQMLHQRPHNAELAAVVHHGDGHAAAQHQLHALIRDLIIQAAGDGTVRDDVAADELAAYCFHALGAASSAASKAAADRLVSVTMAGLRPPV